MRKKIIAFSVIASIGMGSILGEANFASAAESKQSSIETQQSEVEYKLNLANNKISKLQEDQDKAKQEIEKINNDIIEAQQNINEKNKQISNERSKIENLQNQINEVTKRVEKRSALLKDRARSIQETGGMISYVEVLLGAQSFSDFVDRAEAVATIVEADREILEQQQADKEFLEKSKTELKSALLSLENSLAELETIKKDLNIRKEEQKSLMEELTEKEKAVQKEVLSLERERTVLVNKKTEIAKNSSQTQLAAIRIDKNQNPTVQKVNQPGGDGSFIWPTIGGIITTYQGMRWGSFHKGIDIARPADYAILAADSGTVKFAGWRNGYGNTIIIDHNNGYTTQYAHLASINVSVGQAVTQGSKIAVMGSTGNSTGIHLDFEVYNNGKLLNPLDVLPAR